MKGRYPSQPPTREEFSRASFSYGNTVQRAVAKRLMEVYGGVNFMDLARYEEWETWETVNDDFALDMAHQGGRM